MKIHHERLKRLVTSVFAAAGSRPAEAERVAHYLVEANLAGHDSHGVIRVPSYIDWVRTGKVVPNQQAKVVFENDVLAILDGQFGFGQVLGETAMAAGIARAARQGVAVVALRNSGHLGQIGAWALLAARANKLSLHFVNTSGAGLLVPPHGGISRRLSANPVAAGVPVKDGTPVVLDISTSTIAEGKIRVALNKGTQVPEGCLIDSRGRPTTDPKTFYGPPAGAILPFGGHKGYGLSLVAEMLAGALTGGGCSTPGVSRVVNNMLSIFLDPSFFQTEEEFQQEVSRFLGFVKSSEKATADSDIFIPGEPEEQTRQRRSRDGIEVDETTWGQIVQTCRSLGVAPDGAASE
jgi:uncharacterized oxidoreductase